MQVNEAGDAELPDGFLELPAIVYADDPMWVPEEPVAVRRAFHASTNAWYDQGESAAFCVPELARVAAFAPPERYAGGDAYFGYFESVGDEAAERAVIDRVVDWARERGRDMLHGPINFSTYHSYRVRTARHDDGYTFVGEPHSPLRYPDAFRRLGMEQSAGWVSQYTSIEGIRRMYEARRTILSDVTAAGFRFERCTHQMWLDRLDELHPLVDEMFAENFGYTPLSRDDFERVCGESFIRKTCPHTSAIAFAPDGGIAGFFLLYPNWGPLTCAEAGEARVRVSDIDYEIHWPQLLETGKVTAVAKTAATRPDVREKGVFNALGVKLIEPAAVEYDGWYAGMIEAKNWSRRFARADSDDVRTYGLFARSLSD